MTVRFIDGFEQYSDFDPMLRNGWSLLSIGLPTFPVGRDGVGQAMRLTDQVNQMNVGIPDLSPPTFIINFAFKFEGVIQNHIIVRWGDGNNGTQGQLQLSGTEIRIDRGSTQLDITSGLGLILDQWYHLELKVTIDNSAGEYELRIDESDVMSGSGVDNQNTSTTSINHIQFFAASQISTLKDNLVVMDDQGPVNNDFIGDINVVGLNPIGDGNQNDMTVFGAANNWQAVADGSNPDDDTSYVHGNAVDDIELYAFAGAPSDNPEIFAISLTNSHRKEDIGVRTIRNLVRSGGSNFEDPSRAIGVNYRFSMSILENNPDGDTPWIKGSFDAAEFGFTIES